MRHRGMRVQWSFVMSAIHATHIVQWPAAGVSADRSCLRNQITAGMALHDGAGGRHNAALAVGMSGLPYLACAMILNAVFIRYGWKLYRRYSEQLARKAFAWSIVDLALLFAALMADHHCRF
jgi:hypothetical protein